MDGRMDGWMSVCLCVWRLGAPAWDAAAQQMPEPSRTEDVFLLCLSQREDEALGGTAAPGGHRLLPLCSGSLWHPRLGLKGLLPLPSFRGVHPLFSQPKDGKENNLWDRDDSRLVMAMGSFPSQLSRRAVFLGCFPLSK